MPPDNVLITVTTDTDPAIAPVEVPPDSGKADPN